MGQLQRWTREAQASSSPVLGGGTVLVGLEYPQKRGREVNAPMRSTHIPTSLRAISLPPANLCNVSRSCSPLGRCRYHGSPGCFDFLCATYPAKPKLIDSTFFPPTHPAPRDFLAANHCRHDVSRPSAQRALPSPNPSQPHRREAREGAKPPCPPGTSPAPAPLPATVHSKCIRRSEPWTSSDGPPGQSAPHLVAANRTLDDTHPNALVYSSVL